MTKKIIDLQPMSKEITRSDVATDQSKEQYETVTDLVVVAQTPGEMQDAQIRLIQWANAKFAEAKSDAKDLRENYEIAQKRKWRSGAIKVHADKAELRAQYYEKIKSALEAGYCIVPNFPIDVFAIRTTRKKPTPHSSEGWHRPADQETNRPPLGDGRYVSSEARTAEGQRAGDNDHLGKTQFIQTHTAVAFEDPDFPFKLAKPRILSAVAAAMALNIFDEIGVLPGRQGRVAHQVRVNSDPMVIGRIKIRRPYDFREISFLITWFVDTKDI